jgi:hypothetical protein
MREGNLANQPEPTNRSEPVSIMAAPPPRHQHRKYPPPKAPPRPLGFIPTFLRILECQLASETSLRPPSGRWFYVAFPGHAPRESVFAQPRSTPPPPRNHLRKYPPPQAPRRTLGFIPTFLRMLECRLVRCCPFCIRSAVGFFGEGLPRRGRLRRGIRRRRSSALHLFEGRCRAVGKWVRQRWWGDAARVSAVGMATRTATKVDLTSAGAKDVSLACVHSPPFIPTFLRMLECQRVRCCPLCIRSAVGFFGGEFAKTESAAPQESDGSAIHPYLSFSMGAAAPLRNGRVSGGGDTRFACLLSAWQLGRPRKSI